jgi:hypothetical protein
MLSELEMNEYLQIYLREVDPLFTMLCQHDHGTRVVLLLNPRTPAQFITKYVFILVYFTLFYYF